MVKALPPTSAAGERGRPPDLLAPSGPGRCQARPPGSLLTRRERARGRASELAGDERAASERASGRAIERGATEGASERGAKENGASERASERTRASIV